MRTLERPVQNKRGRRSPAPLIVISLITCALIVVLVYGSVKALVDSWSVPKLETVISKSIDRKVKLGNKVGWYLGLNGIVFETDKFVARNLDGSHFVSSGPAKVVVAIGPLFQHEFFIRSIDATYPELWIERLKDGTFKEIDLLKDKSLAKLNHLQFSKGRIHFIDRQPVRPVTHELTDGNFKLDRPFGEQVWPFQFSFAVPRKGYVSRLQGNGIGNGAIEKWSENTYDVSLTGNSVNLADFRILFPALPRLDGKIDVELKGTGVPLKDFTAETTLKSDRITISPPGLGPISLSNASTATKLKVDPQKIVWDDLILRVGTTEMRSNGELIGWTKAVPRYNASVSGRIDRLGQLLANIESDWIKTGLASLPKALALSGNLRLTGEISADERDPRFNMLADLFQTTMTLPGSDLNAHHVNGRIKFDKGILVERVSGILNDTSFTAQGAIDPGRHVDVDIKATGLSVDTVRKALKAFKIDNPVAREPIYGTFASAAIHLQGTPVAPSTILEATPRLLYYQPFGKTRTFEIDGGRLYLAEKNFTLEKVTGSLGKGRFAVSGSGSIVQTAPVNLSIEGRAIDLANVKQSFDALKFNHPLLKEKLLYGLVKTVKLHVTGTPARPVVAMVAHPQHVTFQPLGVERVMHMRGGTLDFHNDMLTIDSVLVSTVKSTFTTSLKLDKLSAKNPRLLLLKLQGNSIDLADMNDFLTSAKTPDVVRIRYVSFLNQFNIAKPHGRAGGSLAYSAMAGGQPRLDGKVKLIDVGGTYKDLAVDRANGTIVAGSNTVRLENVLVVVAASSMKLNGKFDNFTSAERQWTIVFDGAVQPSNFEALLPPGAPRVEEFVIMSEPIAVRGQTTGNRQASTTTFFAKVSPESTFELRSAYGTIARPAQSRLEFSGTIISNPTSFHLENGELFVGEHTLSARGVYRIADEDKPIKKSKKIDNLDLYVTMRDFTPVGFLVAFVPRDASDKSVEAVLESVGGKMRGQMRLAGPIASPLIGGYAELQDVSVPNIELRHINGRIEGMPQSFTTSPDDTVDSSHSTVRLDLSTASMGKLNFANLQGYLVQENLKRKDMFELNQMQATIAGGSLKLDGWFTMSPERPFGLSAFLQKADANELMKMLTGQADEITGTLSAKAVLSGNADGGMDLIRSLKGRGDFTLTDGAVKRFGALEKGIGTANLLEQGLIGFNLNNLLASFNPVHSGAFKTASGNFIMRAGRINIRDFRFDGEELRLRAAGSINLNERNVGFDVAGNIPRITRKGPLGALGNLFSISGIVNLFKPAGLDDLPRIPLLGDFGQKPRAFQFKISAPLDNPDIISDSIYKTFKWLPNQPNATPHPAIDQTQLAGR